MLLASTMYLGVLCGHVSHMGSCMEKSTKNDIFYLVFPKIDAGCADAV